MGFGPATFWSLSQRLNPLSHGVVRWLHISWMLDFFVIKTAQCFISNCSISEFSLCGIFAEKCSYNRISVATRFYLKKLQPCPPDLLLDHCLLFFARILKAHQGVILLLWSAWELLGLEIAWVEIRMHFRNGIFTLHLIRYLRMFYVYQWKKLSQGLVYFFSTYGNITFTA